MTFPSPTKLADHHHKVDSSNTSPPLTSHPHLPLSNPLALSNPPPLPPSPGYSTMSSDSALSDVPDDESVLSSDGSDNPIAARRARLPSSRHNHNQPSPSDPSSVRKKKAAASAQGKAWEGGFERTWDSVREDERGTLQGAVNEEMLGGKTRR